MVKLNAPTRLPSNAYWVVLIKTYIPLFMLSFLFGLIPNASGIFGFVKFFSFVVYPPVALVGLLRTRNILYTVGEKQITIDSGVITSHSNSIAFQNIVSVDCNAGIILGIFGLSDIKLWTASPSQISIKHGRSEKFPSGMLVLSTSDAKWLKDFILGKQTNI